METTEKRERLLLISFYLNRDSLENKIFPYFVETLHNPQHLQKRLPQLAVSHKQDERMAQWNNDSS